MNFKAILYLPVISAICIFTGCASLFDEHGSEFIFNVLPPSAETSGKDIDWNKLAESMEKRLGSIYPDIRHEVSRTEDDHLSVKVSRIPEKDCDTFAGIIGRQGLLQFRLVHENNSELVEAMSKIPDKFMAPEGYEKMFLLDRKDNRIFYFVKSIPEMDGENICSAGSSIDNFGQRYIHISFNPRGASQFSEITRKNSKRQLAIVLDGKLYSAPVIQGVINGGQAQITGNFTREESKEIACRLVAGALPWKLELKEIRGDKSNCIPEDSRSDSELLQEDAQEGKPEAQHALGLMYYSGGMGLQQDYSRAAEWFGRAANSGSPEAAFWLGSLYYNGKGVPKSNAKALEWFRRSAEKGNVNAQYTVGNMHHTGLDGVPVNYKEAETWYLKALDNGCKDVKNELAYLWAEQGINLEQARKFAEEAVQDTPGESAYRDTLGWVLFKQGNYAEAVKQFEKASEISPDDAVPRDHLACAYLKLGENGKAKAQWTKALELKPDEKLKERIKSDLEALGRHTR